MRRLVAGILTAGLSVALSGFQPVGASGSTMYTHTLSTASGTGKATPYHPQARQTTSSKVNADPPDYVNDPGRDTGYAGNSAPSVQSSPSVPVAAGSSISLTGTATSAKGQNAYDHLVAHGSLYQVVPPDQGLCAGNGSVLEPVNMVMGLYNESTFAPIANETQIPVETLFGTPYAFGVNGGDYTIQGDVRCYWDQDTQRWFVTQLADDLTTGRAYIEIAASTSATPDIVPADIPTHWNVYMWDVTDDGNSDAAAHTSWNSATHNITPAHNNCPCFGDQPLLGADHNAIFISTNEYNNAGTAFNGAQLYVWDKAALATGGATHVESFDLGEGVPTPESTQCYTNPADPTTATGLCWYSVEPAQSPWNGTAAATFDSRNSGTGYALSALQFGDTGNYDNRVATWGFTNTSSISVEPSVAVHVTVIGSENYGFPFANCAQWSPGTCPFPINQKAGPTPTYDVLKATHPDYGNSPHPNEVTSNDDRMLQTVYANGNLYSALNTVDITTPCTTSVNYCAHTAQAWFKVAPGWSDGLIASMTQQGYVAPSGADALFGAIGVDNRGNAVLSFTLTGPGWYPSSAYVMLPGTGGSGHAPAVHVSALGQSPEDSSTEYACWNGTGASCPWRPRFGDYGAAVADGGNIYFASEYIQYANCSDATFAGDMTCGGTRSARRNWGTSINKIAY